MAREDRNPLLYDTIYCNSSFFSRGKIKATSNFTRLGEDSPGSSNSFVYENKDDTFDKLFVNVDSAKVRVPSIPMDVSAAEHNSNQESANDSGNCWGLFKSFHEKVSQLNLGIQELDL